MILDADVLVDLFRKHPGAWQWLRSLQTQPTISGIAALEVLYGARDSIQQRDVDRWLNKYDILWPNEANSKTARTLAPFRLSNGIEMTDTITAAIALRHMRDLVTFNVKHYQAIPGLSTLQPYSHV